MFVCFLVKERTRVDPDGRDGWEEQGGGVGRLAITKIYHMKNNQFLIKEINDSLARRPGRLLAELLQSLYFTQASGSSLGLQLNTSCNSLPPKPCPVDHIDNPYLTTPTLNCIPAPNTERHPLFKHKSCLPKYNVSGL